jgi:hypothetical protein
MQLVATRELFAKSVAGVREIHESSRDDRLAIRNSSGP